MGQTVDRVLKGSDVEIDGRLSLDLEHPAAPGQNSRHAASAAKVRMLENQSEFAVMEVTCCCGRKTIIRCDYGVAAAVKGTAPGQNIAVSAGPEKYS